MPCVIGAVWTAFAYATELSDRTLSASAALIGAAMFAFTSDMTVRSGSASPVCTSSSSIVMYVICFSSLSCLDRLRDRCHLLCARHGGRVVRKNVGRERQVDRQREVRVHERHRRSLGQQLGVVRLELCARQLRHESPPFRRADVPSSRRRLVDRSGQAKTARLAQQKQAFPTFFAKLR